MTYILFGIGILFIILGFVDVFPKIKENYIELEEMQKWQLQKKEVIQAKEDLIYLLEELKNVSDQAVNSIEDKINEAKSIDLATKSTVMNFIEEKKDKIKSNPKEKKIKEDKNIKVDIGRDNADGIITKDVNDNNILDKHTYIYQLSKQGISIDEIAQKVQMGKGEIELIIGIKRRGEQA